MSAQFVITEPSGRRRVVPLQKEAPLSIGRGTGNGVILFDPEVSRKHCTVRWDGSAFTLEDNGSQNGTYINGQPIRGPERLRDGVEIALGHCRMRFVLTWEGRGVVARGRIGKFAVSAMIVALMAVMGGALGLTLGGLRPAGAGNSPPDSPGVPAVTSLAANVKTSPPAAMVFLNGQFIGVAPVELPRQTGRYSLRVQLAGYKPSSKALQIENGMQDVNIDLEPIQQAVFNISSEPSDADILLDGCKVGKTPLKIPTAPGTHEIVLQKTNYVSWAGTVDVDPGSTLNVAEGMEPRSAVAYLQLLQEDPNNVSYYCELAHVYILEHRIAEAYDCLRKAMETFCQGKDTSSYAPRMKWLFDKIYFGDYFDVAEKEQHEEIRKWIISLYGEMIRKYPEQKTNLLAWLSEILKRAGRTDDLNVVIQDAGGEPNLDIYFQAADLYLDKGKFQRAVGILNKAVVLGPKNCKAALKLGQACLLWCKNGKRELKDDAIKNLENALKLCNDDAAKKQIQALLQEAMKL